MLHLNSLKRKYSTSYYIITRVLLVLRTIMFFVINIVAQKS
jgi:hypothetical protein